MGLAPVQRQVARQSAARFGRRAAEAAQGLAESTNNFGLDLLIPKNVQGDLNEQLKQEMSRFFAPENLATNLALMAGPGQLGMVRGPKVNLRAAMNEAALERTAFALTATPFKELGPKEQLFVREILARRIAAGMEK